MRLDRDAALEKVAREERSDGDRVRYTITFDPKLPYLPPILSKNWHVMVETDPRLTKAFPKPPMACLKRGPNLKDRLIRARLPPRVGRAGTRTSDGPRPGFRCCKAGRRGCSLCPFTGEASDKKSVVSQVKIHHSGQIIPIHQSITCKSEYCLYVLSCKKPGCQQQYVGLCYRALYLRFAEHLASIRDPSSTCTVGRHWQQPGHTLEHLEFQGVEKLGTKCRVTLREREKALIASTGVLSAGLNINI